MRRPLLIVDSGSGGFTVLDAIRERLPGLSYSYAADYAGCPYGERSPEEIMRRTMALVNAAQARRQHGMIVIACNTASTQILPQLRDVYSIPVVGVVPAIKPACERYPMGTLLLLATPQTVQGDYLDDLVARFSQGVRLDRYGSTDLVRLAEASLHVPPTLKDVARVLSSVPAKSYDAVILGCTHFPLLKVPLKLFFGDAELIDSAQGIASRVFTLDEDRLSFNAENAFYVTQRSGPPSSFFVRYALPDPDLVELNL